MANNDFELWLGQAAKERPFCHQVHKALNLAGGAPLRSSGNRMRRFDGSRIGRGSGVGRMLSEFSRYSGGRGRRVVVKMRIVRLAGHTTKIAAHLRYMQRGGTTREGGRGTLYSADLDNADSKAFLCRSHDDRHQFRLIVAPEDGAEYEKLMPLVRRLLEQAEVDLATRLDWVAADHFNTGHPHSHILIRGKDDKDNDLIIAREYITEGLRGRAAGIVNIDLGPRTDSEIMRANMREMDQERFTEIDCRLLQSTDEDGLISPQHCDRIEQSLRTGRLATLGRMGLAIEEHRGRWRLPDDLETTLRAMGRRGEMIATLDREVRARGLAASPARYAIYDPGGMQSQPIAGQIVARGLSDEESGHEYLILDGIDGHVHYVEIGPAGCDHGREGAIVRISPTMVAVRKVDRSMEEIAAANPFPLERQRANPEPVQIEPLGTIPLEQMPSHNGITWLDEDPSLAQLVEHGNGFASKVADAMRRRQQWLLEQGLADKPARFKILQGRELQRMIGQLSSELGAHYTKTGSGLPIEGSYRRCVQVGTTRLALIENAREFTLVPWQSMLERRIGREVSGMMRGKELLWNIGRQRSGPEI